MDTLTGGNGTGMVMPVQPLNNGYGYPVAMPYGGNGGGGLFGGNGDSWLGILFLIALCNGGWGGFGGFGGGYGAMMGGMMGYEFPWLMTGQQNINANTNNGFRDQMINDNITSVRDGISALSTQLCGCCGDMQMSMANGFAGVNQNVSQTGNAIQNAVNQGFASTNLGMCQGFNGVNTAISGVQAAIAQQMNTNEIANLNRSFAEQMANSQGFNNVGTGIADLKYTVATENCADRTAAAQNTRDIIDAVGRGNQAILDKLCALELDGVKSQLAQAQRENVGLQNAVNMATMQASQTAQTAQILAGQAAEIDGVYNRLKNCPVPSMPVYGNTPIFTCPQNQYSGCGCGNGTF